MNRLFALLIIVFCSCSMQQFQNENTSDAIVGAWELRATKEPVSYPPERVYLVLREDGSCVFAIIRINYNFAADGTLLSLNTFGSDTVQGEFSVVNNILSVKLPDDFDDASRCPVGRLQEISDETFQVVTKSGDIHSFFHYDEEAER